MNTIDRLGSGVGILSATDRPDMLLHVEDVRHLEGLLLAEWWNGSVATGRPVLTRAKEWRSQAGEADAVLQEEGWRVDLCSDASD